MIKVKDAVLTLTAVLGTRRPVDVAGLAVLPTVGASSGLSLWQHRTSTWIIPGKDTWVGEGGHPQVPQNKYKRETKGGLMIEMSHIQANNKTKK